MKNLDTRSIIEFLNGNFTLYQFEKIRKEINIVSMYFDSDDKLSISICFENYKYIIKIIDVERVK